MQVARITDAKRRLLERLKRSGKCSAAELASQLGLTAVAIRQHLAALEERGLVTQETGVAQGRGRPPALWELTELAQGLFPDRHGELAVDLIGAVESALGAEGLERVIAARARDQIEAYRRSLPPPSASLRSRVEGLARLRTAEGYMAETRTLGPGSYLLIEHHCPVCEAASSCLGLCHSELEVFRRALGDDAAVERVEHLLSGGERCVYRIESPSHACDD